MIGNPVALRIRTIFSRAPSKIQKDFGDFQTSLIADAQNGEGCLNYKVKPLLKNMRFSGTALTADCGPMDNLAAMAVLDYAKSGDVIVIATHGDMQAAKIGDLWALAAKKLNVAAVVCDGLVRDIDGLLSTELPIFAAGISPNSGFRNGPGTVNEDIVCGGVTISPGDIIVGDANGVIRIKSENASMVLDTTQLINSEEKKIEKKIRQMKNPSFWDEKNFPGKIEIID